MISFVSSSISTTNFLEVLFLCEVERSLCDVSCSMELLFFSTLVDLDRALDLDRARDLDRLGRCLLSLVPGWTCDSATAADRDGLAALDGAFEDDRRCDGATEEDRPRDDTTLSTGCLDLDLDRLFLAIERDRPLLGAAAISTFRPRAMYSSGRKELFRMEPLISLEKRPTW